MISNSETGTTHPQEERAGSPGHIVLVDDSPTKNAKIASHLRSAGFTVASANNGADGLALASREQPDAIVSDVLMPEMDGFELCQLVRADDVLGGTPVILVSTVFDKREDREFALKIGADAYFDEEEIDEGELALTIRNAIVQRRGPFGIRLPWEGETEESDGTDLFQQEHAERLRVLANRKVEELERSYNELAAAYDGILEGLIRALDLRDTDTELHSWRVTEYTLLLGKRAGLGWDELTHIERGALLHDIGKIGIPDAILRKPGPLDDDQWAEMRKHPELGYEMLTGIDFLREASGIVLTHHERWDGRGYPRGLAGEAIPIGARIFALADTIDAITSDRPYRAGSPFDEALEELTRNRGTQFDPTLVDLALEVEPRLWESLRERVELRRHAKRSQRANGPAEPG